EIDPALERPERGGETREADDRVQNDVRLRLVEQLGQVSADLRERSEPVDLLRAGRCCDELELGVRGHDLDRLAPDRSGRAEQRYAFHRLSVETPPLRALRGPTGGCGAADRAIEHPPSRSPS